VPSSSLSSGGYKEQVVHQEKPLPSPSPAPVLLSQDENVLMATRDYFAAAAAASAAVVSAKGDLEEAADYCYDDDGDDDDDGRKLSNLLKCRGVL